MPFRRLRDMTGLDAPTHPATVQGFRLTTGLPAGITRAERVGSAAADEDLLDASTPIDPAESRSVARAEHRLPARPVHAETA